MNFAFSLAGRELWPLFVATSTSQFTVNSSLSYPPAVLTSCALAGCLCRTLVASPAALWQAFVLRSGSLRVLRSGSLQVLRSGSLRVLHFGSLQVLRSGSPLVLRSGSLRVLQFGSLPVLRSSSLQVLRSGSLLV